MTLKIGDKLYNGRYTIYSITGKNDFTSTYLATDGNKDKFVIKSLDSPFFQQLPLTSKNQIEDIFKKEAKKLAQCKSFYIPDAKEPFKENEIWCIAMEYIEGISLEEYAQEPLPEEESLLYIKNLGMALREAHSKGLLHLDINPKNIIVKEKTRAVLVGFSFIKNIKEKTVSRVNPYSELSPIEMLTEKIECDQRTDIYSLAATLYFILTQKLPPYALDFFNKASLDPKIDFVNKINSNIFKAICSGMGLTPHDGTLQKLSIDTWFNNRSKSIDEWLQSLGVNVDMIPGSEASAPSSTPISKRSINWQVVAAIIAAIGTLLAGIAAFMGLLKQPTTSPTPSSSPLINSTQQSSPSSNKPVQKP